MMNFSEIAQAIAAIRAFERNPPASLSDFLADKLLAVSNELSPVVVICGFGETLYANREELNDEAKSLCGGLIAYAAMNGWHGLAGPRGLGIVQAMRREIGDTSPTGTWPDPKDDPAPDAAFTPSAPALIITPN